MFKVDNNIINSPKITAISPVLKNKKNNIKILAFNETDDDDFFEYY